MKRWKKVVASLLVVAVGIPLLFSVTMYAYAWCQRLRAERLLAIVRTIKPGVTTQGEYMEAMQPPESDPLDLYQNDEAKGYRVVVNAPQWFLNHVGLPSGRDDMWSVMQDKLANHATGIVVIPSFKDGVVSRIHVWEMHGVCTHRCGGSVIYEAQRFETSDNFGENFNGYASWQGSISAGTPPWVVAVDMDERASAEQVRRAFDFEFHCFTDFHVCEDAREYLDPAPNR